METFTIRDLRERTGELVRGAESGKLSIVTKHGRPVFLAVPFDEDVVKCGLPLVLAMRLFQDDVLSIGAAAKLAGKTIPEFITELGSRGISAVRYSQDELKHELSQVAELADR